MVVTGEMKVTYSAEEKKQLDRILSVFQEYIRAHWFFDIIYSEKVGFIRIKVEDPDDGEGLIVIRSAAQMMDVLINEVINDVRFEDRETKHYFLKLSEAETEEVRRRVTKILGAMGPDAEEYLLFLDRYMIDYPHNAIED